MEENRTAHKIIYGVLALAALLVLFVCTYPLSNRLGVRNSEKQTADVVIFGDSIIASCQDETGVAAKMMDRIDMEVFNAALGGTCAAHKPTDYDEGYYKGALPFCEISLSVLTDEFGPQLKARDNESATDYFVQSIARMGTTDYSSVKYYCICYGVNDYHAGIPIANEEDPCDINTYKGAMRFGIRNIKEACPGARVVLMTPPYTWYTGKGLSCEEYSPEGTYLNEYVQAVVELAAEENCILLDLYNELYDQRNFYYWNKYTEDGVHPNEQTREAIADKLCRLIEIYEG